MKPFSRATRCWILSLPPTRQSDHIIGSQSARTDDCACCLSHLWECQSCGAARRGLPTMNPDVSAILEPLYEHIEAVLCELVAQPRRLFIRVAEVLRGMALPLSAPAIEGVPLVVTW